MPKHVAWGARRHRWVFQMRVPKSILPAIGGRTHIRVHLGDIPQSQALEEARLLSCQYRVQFKQLRGTEVQQPRPTPRAIECFHIKALDISRRLAATWQMGAARNFEARPVDARWGGEKHWMHLDALQTLNAKTREKYRAITQDLAIILGRRPLQVLDRHDVSLLKALWVQRGNNSNTVREKLRILQALLRRRDPGESLLAEVQQAIPGRTEPKTARLPFTAAQLADYLCRLSRGTRPADRLLIQLMLLLAARISKVYQLQARDFTPAEQGWLVRIADHRQTGSGDAPRGCRPRSP